MRIITVNREFGSGGRELGKRLADALDIAYYDREIITILAERSSLDKGYIERIIEHGSLRGYPITCGQTLSNRSISLGDGPSLLAQQHKVIREIAAKEDCLIVGRGADYVLQEYRPFKLFVYADMAAKINRCRTKGSAGENLTDSELKREMRQIDKARANSHDFMAPCAWNDKHGYHLCINTTGLEIKNIVPHIAAYAEDWFKK
ncbi:MAG: cytidylate kinase-like family protein [Bacillota bacterium]|nr:cytidylate kinase-like family protein [Bacillota bacterium]